MVEPRRENAGATPGDGNDVQENILEDWLQEWLQDWMLFVNSNRRDLELAKKILILSPEKLSYVGTRLANLQEMEGLRENAPMEYLSLYASDLGDYRRLRDLQSTLQRLKLLRIAPSVKGADQTLVDLTHFGALHTLELHWCNLEAAPLGLQALHVHLHRLICTGPLPSLHHILVGAGKDVEDAAVWPCLTHLSCQKTGLASMDSSLTLLPVVETLDLSRGNITAIENIQVANPRLPPLTATAA
ncbi:hypothetical protein CYMTET_29230 [Cymbomonas tetramitiformis]|uniref:Uncharacterized protein n=1 Tax=Cymbomonas tetramitiformis TaxID=36881 RepID=A0AAE0FLJ1_9CHLO|nr:hypothetical protein CYMTET_29230 [Cymbomonas tetramitiformis]